MLITGRRGLEALTLPPESKTTGNISAQRMKDLAGIVIFFHEHLLPPSQRDINGKTRRVLMSMNPSSNNPVP